MLRPIMALPESDGPRRDYAEFLEKRGDPRGEFIRIQLRIAEIYRAQESRAELAGLTPRERNLLASHERDWVAIVASVSPGRCIFYRGFVEGIEIDARTFPGRADELYKRAPILHLTVRGGAGAVRDLCQCRALSRIVSLDFHQQQIGDEGAEAIASSPHLERLAWLDLRGNKLTKRGIEALAASKRLPRLRWLDVQLNDFQNPVDEPDEIDGESIIHYDGSSPLGKELEARYGQQAWMHFRPSNTRWLPPSPLVFEPV